MAKNKFYVVIKGHQPGIYTTWAECQKQTSGFSSAIFKSFRTEAEAQQYWQINNKTELIEYDYNIYTDGSYTAHDNKMGFGWLMIYQNSIVKQECGPVNDKYGSNNYISELYAMFNAMRFLYSNFSGVSVKIYTDSNDNIFVINNQIPRAIFIGWEQWQAEYKSNNNFFWVSQILLIYFNLLQKNIKVHFEHVDAHVGHEYNEIADRLADQGRQM